MTAIFKADIRKLQIENEANQQVDKPGFETGESEASDDYAAGIQNEQLHSLNDWPNEAGFQTDHEQRTPIELSVTGLIPAHAAGTLYRAGPASYKVARSHDSDFMCSHWFDGFAQTHRFQIIPQADGKTRVIYSSRRSTDAAIEKVKNTGKYPWITFGQRRDPCIGLFGKLMSIFVHTPTDPSELNISVTLQANMPGFPPARTEEGGHRSRVKSLWAASDHALLRELDPQTLEPIGIAHQRVLHPDLTGPLSCAHSMTDPETGDVFNYNLAFGRHATYRVFKTSATTGQTETLATITGEGVEPAYIHSFFMTEDFVILCLWNSRLAWNGLKVLVEKNMLDAISPFDPSQPAKWFVVDRKHSRGLVGEFESPATFSFHTVNAWQVVDSEGNMDIICDHIAYENLDILHAFYYSNMMSSGKDAVAFRSEKGKTCVPQLKRYRLAGIVNETLDRGNGKRTPQAELILTTPKHEVGDLPTVNPRFKMKENRWLYSIVNRGYSNFLDGISKYDFHRKVVQYWENPQGHTPSEVVFIPNPESEAEDDGLLLSVILDGFNETSYLICLDAKTMKETGRAQCDFAIGHGFHGLHIQY